MTPGPGRRAGVQTGGLPFEPAAWASAPEPGFKREASHLIPGPGPRPKVQTGGHVERLMSAPSSVVIRMATTPRILYNDRKRVHMVADDAQQFFIPSSVADRMSQIEGLMYNVGVRRIDDCSFFFRYPDGYTSTESGTLSQTVVHKHASRRRQFKSSSHIACTAAIAPPPCGL